MREEKKTNVLRWLLPTDAKDRQNTVSDKVSAPVN